MRFLLKAMDTDRLSVTPYNTTLFVRQEKTSTYKLLRLARRFAVHRVKVGARWKERRKSSVQRPRDFSFRSWIPDLGNAVDR